MSVPVTTLRRLSPQVVRQLAQLGIQTIEDLFLHFPLRYENRTQITPLSQLKVGESALIEGVIQTAEIKTGGKKRSLICKLADESGTIFVRFFHFSQAQRQHLKTGIKLRCFGEIRQGYYGLELIHPEYKQITFADPFVAAERLTPVYPTCGHLTQNLLRSLTTLALEDYPQEDYIPKSLGAESRRLPLMDALRLIHYPPFDTPLESLQTRRHPAYQRLIFEELLAHRLGLRFLHNQIQQRQAPGLDNSGKLVATLRAQLPFTLTAAQQRVAAEIARDLRQSHPMQRLLQGDVGSGKTILAAFSALQAIESGYQVAVMAPTELLSEQHLQTFSHWLQPLQIPLTWLTGSLTKKQRTHALADISSGQTALVIGTHALFQEHVKFANLGLVIVDEQHRFGVQQRLALWTKGKQEHSNYPHQLIMTATPIPRTLAMTAYADLDVSTLDELPPGRIPVNTVVVPNTRRGEVIARIRHVCQQGRQAYWVCTLIEDSEALQLQAAEQTAEHLQEVLPQINIGLVHGRMKTKEKERVMAEFKAGEITLLVATTVIEVGVDVPNASLMIIENAERLGLAQLHQLRGRVGRSTLQSYCVLLYQPPLSEIAQARLTAIRTIHDGFVIAQRDLELRGPGEVLGTRQTGSLNFRVADIQRDEALLGEVVKTAQTLLKEHPEQCQLLMKRWLKEGWQCGEV